MKFTVAATVLAASAFAADVSTSRPARRMEKARSGPCDCGGMKFARDKGLHRDDQDSFASVPVAWRCSP